MLGAGAWGFQSDVGQEGKRLRFAVTLTSTSRGAHHGNQPHDKWRTGVDAAFAQFKDSGEQFVTAARKAGNLYLDSYEKAVDRAVDFELKVAEATPQEWLKELIETQAKLTKDLTARTRAPRAVS